MNTETVSKPESQSTEEFHRTAEAAVRTFSYVKPDMTSERRSKRVDLGRTDIIKGVAQIWKKGGETELHYHAGTDSLWIVLKGKARFYGPDNLLIGEFGPQEGVIMPRGARYWFENSQDEDLEILQVVSYAEKGARDTGRTIIGAHS